MNNQFPDATSWQLHCIRLSIEERAFLPSWAYGIIIVTVSWSAALTLGILS